VKYPHVPPTDCCRLIKSNFREALVLVLNKAVLVCPNPPPLHVISRHLSTEYLNSLVPNIPWDGEAKHGVVVKAFQWTYIGREVGLSFRRQSLPTLRSGHQTSEGGRGRQPFPVFPAYFPSLPVPIPWGSQQRPAGWSTTWDSQEEQVTTQLAPGCESTRILESTCCDLIFEVNTENNINN